MDHVNESGVAEQYAFTVSLNRPYCRNVGFLEEKLPKDELKKMQRVACTGGLYDSDEGHTVAARMKRLDYGTGQHTKWRLLLGDQNSPVQKLLAGTSNESSCLIFFTLNSPCVEKCLRETGTYRISKMMRDTFSPIAYNTKAFVFQEIYQELNMMPQRWLRAWLRLHHVPLLRCKNNRCRYCFRNDINSIKCLAM